MDNKTPIEELEELAKNVNYKGDKKLLPYKLFKKIMVGGATNAQLGSAQKFRRRFVRQYQNENCNRVTWESQLVNADAHRNRGFLNTYANKLWQLRKNIINSMFIFLYEIYGDEALIIYYLNINERRPYVHRRNPMHVSPFSGQFRNIRRDVLVGHRVDVDMLGNINFNDGRARFGARYRGRGRNRINILQNVNIYHPKMALTVLAHLARLTEGKRISPRGNMYSPNPPMQIISISGITNDNVYSIMSWNHNCLNLNGLLKLVYLHHDPLNDRYDFRDPGSYRWEQMYQGNMEERFLCHSLRHTDLLNLVMHYGETIQGGGHTLETLIMKGPNLFKDYTIIAQKRQFCEKTEHIIEHAYLCYYNYCLAGNPTDVHDPYYRAMTTGQVVGYRDLANAFFKKMTSRREVRDGNALTRTGTVYGDRGGVGFSQATTMPLTEAISFLIRQVPRPQGGTLALVRNDLRIDAGNRNFVLGQLETITGFDFPGQQARIQDLEAQIQDLEARIRQLQNRNQELQTRNQDGQQARIQDLQARIGQLQATNQELQTTNQRLDDQINGINPNLVVNTYNTNQPLFEDGWDS